MPIYEYECLACKKNHEVMQKITEGPLTKCPDCGGKLRKKISNTSFVLKGTGWYATDYASDKNKSYASDRKKAHGTGAKDEKGAAAKPEKKTDTKADTKEVKKTGTKETAASG